MRLFYRGRHRSTLSADLARLAAAPAVRGIPFVDAEQIAAASRRRRESTAEKIDEQP